MRSLRGVIVLMVALLGAAAAQATQVGQLEVTVDGETRTLYAYELMHEGELATTTTFTVRTMAGSPFANLYAQFHADDSFQTAGAFSFDASFSGTLAACPCAALFADAYYWTTSALYSDFYQAIEWEVTLVSAADNGDGSYSLEGEFTALMGYVDDAADNDTPDPSRTLQVSGAFVITRALQD